MVAMVGMEKASDTFKEFLHVYHMNMTCENSNMKSVLYRCVSWLFDTLNTDVALELTIHTTLKHL